MVRWSSVMRLGNFEPATKSQCLFNSFPRDAAIAWREQKLVNCTLPQAVHATSQAKSNCNPPELVESHPLYHQQLVRPPSLQSHNFSARPANYAWSHCLHFLGYPIAGLFVKRPLGRPEWENRSKGFTWLSRAIINVIGHERSSHWGGASW